MVAFACPTSPSQRLFTPLPLKLPMMTQVTNQGCAFTTRTLYSTRVWRLYSQSFRWVTGLLPSMRADTTRLTSSVRLW